MLWRVLKWGVAGGAVGCIPGLFGLLAHRPTAHDWGPLLALFLLFFFGPVGAVVGLVYGAIRVTGRIGPAVGFCFPLSRVGWSALSWDWNRTTLSAGRCLEILSTQYLSFRRCWALQQELPAFGSTCDGMMTVTFQLKSEQGDEPAMVSEERPVLE